jgi:hypothetical protein
MHDFVLCHKIYSLDLPQQEICSDKLNLIFMFYEIKQRVRKIVAMATLAATTYILAPPVYGALPVTSLVRASGVVLRQSRHEGVQQWPATKQKKGLPG